MQDRRPIRREARPPKVDRVRAVSWYALILAVPTFWIWVGFLIWR